MRGVHVDTPHDAGHAETDDAPIVCIVATSRRRRVSQPSIHLPRSVYSPSRHCGAPVLIRFSRDAKNSSFAARTVEPRRSDARSIRSRNDAVIAAGPRPARMSRPSCQTRRPADERRSHDPTKTSSGIRRELVALLQLHGIHGCTPLQDPKSPDPRRTPLRCALCRTDPPGALAPRSCSGRQKNKAPLGDRRAATKWSQPRVHTGRHESSSDAIPPHAR